MGVTVSESLFHFSGYFLLTLFLSLVLQLKKSLRHLFSDLFRGFKVRHELLLVDSIFSLKELLQSLFKNKKYVLIIKVLPLSPVNKICFFSSLEISHSVTDLSIYLFFLRVTMFFWIVLVVFISHWALCKRFLSPRSSF